MPDHPAPLTRRVEAIDTKLSLVSSQLHELSASVDRRFDSVDERFQVLEAALIEQRQYTEFGYAQLDAKMQAGFARLDDKIAGLDSRVAGLDSKVAGLDSKVVSGIGRLERKLDQFIDVQLRTNQLADRRLRALEERRPRP